MSNKQNDIWNENLQEIGICKLCIDGGFTVSPCPHMEQTKESWGEIPNEPCDFPLECEHGSTGRCDKCGIETWEERFEKLWTIGSIGVQINFGKFTSAKDIAREFTRCEISSAVQKERERIINEILEFEEEIYGDQGEIRGHVVEVHKIKALNERDI